MVGDGRRRAFIPVIIQLTVGSGPSDGSIWAMIKFLRRATYLVQPKLGIIKTQKNRSHKNKAKTCDTRSGIKIQLIKKRVKELSKGEQMRRRVCRESEKFYSVKRKREKLGL
jgi:hypothetical protein